MKVWITKYALSTGIEAREADLSIGDPNCVCWSGRYHKNYEFKPHWYTTEAEALARAETMRAAKLVSLRKQFAKVEALKFKTSEAKE